MAQTSVAHRPTIDYVDGIVEQVAIHAAVCRARRAGLCCGTCAELAERAARSAVAVAEAA